MKGQTGENLMIMLESDLTMFFSVWDSQEQEKKLVRSLTSKHVLVNGKCVNIPSYLVKS